MKSNVYTVLIVIAFLVLVVGVGTLYRAQQQLFGTSNPFEVPQSKAGR